MPIPDLLKLLFSTFPPPPTGTAEAQLAAYALSLEGCDERDIEAAVRNFLAGSAPGHNPAFVPSAPLLGAEVRRVMNLRLDSEARTRASRPALPPPDIERSPESRERVRRLMEQTTRRMGEAMQTEDAAADKRRKQTYVRVHDYFAPDMTEDAMLKRLGYEVGDNEGAADAA